MDRLFGGLFSELPCYVTAQDRQFRVTHANRMFREDFGGHEGSFCYEVYKRRSERCQSCPVALTFEDGKRHQSEEIVRLKDGKEINVMAFTSPILDEGGHVVGAIELAADITDVKQMQQKYRALFEQVPCYISVQNRNLKITDANHRFVADFGDGLGRLCFEVYKHRTEACVDCPVAKTFDDGKVHHSEEVVTRQDGGRRNVLCYTAPIRDPRGEIGSVMEMSTDITDVRQLQSRLTSLGMLVGSISHGIKGLLTGLDGGMYLVESGFSKDNQARVQEGWQMVQRNVERIRRMVMNVLYYAKDREVFWQPVDIAQLLSTIKEEVEGRAARLNVELEVKCEEGTCEADPDALHSLLMNLFQNALDACRVDKRDIQHRVRMSARIEGDHAVFVVGDNGIGMDQETREKAFELFFSSKGAEGTGLGLFIANKIATAHHGAVEIESELGRGTTFVVRLPRTRPVGPLTG